jgi:hypothetical protein
VCQAHCLVLDVQGHTGDGPSGSGLDSVMVEPYLLERLYGDTSTGTCTMLIKYR